LNFPLPENASDCEAVKRHTCLNIELLDEREYSAAEFGMHLHCHFLIARHSAELRIEEQGEVSEDILEQADQQIAASREASAHPVELLLIQLGRLRALRRCQQPTAINLSRILCSRDISFQEAETCTESLVPMMILLSFSIGRLKL
jgi:hypothetical protein